MPNPRFKPRHFFLNERHELPVEQREGFGGVRYYANVDWAGKGRRIASSLASVEQHARASHDPLSGKRFFILAAPETGLQRQPGPKAKSQALVDETVDFRGEHARVFEKLGIDLLRVNRDGSATVHAEARSFEKLRAWATEFTSLGTRDKARWASLAKFDWIPPEFKVNETWLAQLDAKKPSEAYIELQPMLERFEADDVIRALDTLIRGQAGESLRGVFADYSGRYWLDARLTPATIKRLVREFFSVDSIHAPLLAFPSAMPPEFISASHSLTVSPIGRAPRTLPCVAVADSGVKQQHLQLEPFQRGIKVGEGCSPDPYESHGTQVASRVVFGDLQRESAERPLIPACSFFNVSLVEGVDPSGKPRIRAKSVVPAVRDVVQDAPDVRVINLSIDSRLPLDEMSEPDRRNTVALIEDLDNFVFDHDVIVVVAAGNSPERTPPPAAKRYPAHLDEPEWRLRSWSRAFNALTCGGTVPRLCIDGIAKRENAPSPFTRIGPGFADSRKPDFCAPAGDCGVDYDLLAGGGVHALTHDGYLAETIGTSFAAPLLAREAALAFERLREIGAVPSGGRVFAVTVKALLAATARQPELTPDLRKLAERTLGRGFASASPLSAPQADRALFVWQGLIESRSDIVRVQVPLPRAWLAEAISPQLRIVCAADVPANAAAENVWASRKISLSLSPNPEKQEGVKLPRGGSDAKGAYPLFERTFDLSAIAANDAPHGDSWVVILRYEDTAAGYRPGRVFLPEQRVAFVAELRDGGEGPSPQAFVQSLPIANTLNQLSAGIIGTQTAIGITP